MDVDTLIGLNPPAWHKFFFVMRKHSLDPWRKMDEYYDFEFKTQFVERPSSLAELVSHLSAPEPVVRDCKIKRVPRLFHFPSLMQRHLVWFLYRHKKELPLASVSDMVNLLGTDVVVEKDKTLGTAYNLFKSLATKRTVEKKELNHYNFSRGTKDRAAALIRRFSRCVEKPETPPVSPGLQTCLDGEDPNRISQHSIVGTQPSFMEVATPQGDLSSADNSTINETVADVQNIPAVTPNTSKIIISHSALSQDVSRKRKLSASPEDWEKKKKPDDNDLNDTDSENILSEDLADNIRSLRNSWTSGNLIDSQLTQASSVLEQLSESQMRAACQILKLAELSDTECAAACSHFVAKSRTLSFCNVAVFAENCILPKLMSLDQPCLRLLLDTFTSFAENFYHQMAACVFVPLLKTEQFNQYQATVISEVIKESFDEEQKKLFFGLATKAKLTWTEVTVSVFHPVINYKMKLNPDECHDVLSQLSDASLSLSNNLKFTKMLVSFINIYACQLNVEDHQRLNHVTNINTTFLKKAALAALKKIKS